MTDYTTTLFNCTSDVGICMYTSFCMPCAMGNEWGMITGVKCGCEHLFCTMNPYWMRQFIRSRKHMKKRGCYDTWVCCCCMPCMVCQDYRELKVGYGLPSQGDCLNQYDRNDIPPPAPQQPTLPDRSAPPPPIYPMPEPLCQPTDAIYPSQPYGGILSNPYTSADEK